jgi:hypothetical protein
MSASRTGYQGFTSDVDSVAADFFEPKLRSLGLGVDQIGEQDVEALEESLSRID